MARRHLLLTGAPGVGKSTVVRKVAEALARDGVAIGGFRTGEIRDGGRRVGFRVTTFDGREAVLAHIDLAGPQRVGRYGVDVAALDRIVAGALAPDGLHLVDEIGPMECFSPRFKEAVRRLLSSRIPQSELEFGPMEDQQIVLFAFVERSDYEGRFPLALEVENPATGLVHEVGLTFRGP